MPSKLIAATGRRRALEFWLVVAAGLFAVVADLSAEGPVDGTAAYVIAAMPGLLVLLVFRSLLAAAAVVLMPGYLYIAAYHRGSAAHVPAIALDRALPVRPEWMLVYGSLYIFVIVLMMLVVRRWDLLRRAIQAHLFVMLLSYAVFLFYPTIASRPEVVPGDGFWAWTLRGMYDMDPPYNCFPSLHVAYSFVTAFACYRVHRRVGIAALIWAALIGVSTVYTKQHYVLDAIAGAALGCVAYVIFLRRFDPRQIPEIDRDRAPRRALGAVGLYALGVAGMLVAYSL